MAVHNCTTGKPVRCSSGTPGDRLLHHVLRLLHDVIYAASWHCCLLGADALVAVSAVQCRVGKYPSDLQE